MQIKTFALYPTAKQRLKSRPARPATLLTRDGRPSWSGLAAAAESQRPVGVAPAAPVSAAGVVQLTGISLGLTAGAGPGRQAAALLLGGSRHAGAGRVAVGPLRVHHLMVRGRGMWRREGMGSR